MRRSIARYLVAGTLALTLGGCVATEHKDPDSKRCADCAKGACERHRNDTGSSYNASPMYYPLPSPSATSPFPQN
jgi:hypothetical protein